MVNEIRLLKDALANLVTAHDAEVAKVKAREREENLRINYPPKTEEQIEATRRLFDDKGRKD